LVKSPIVRIVVVQIPPFTSFEVTLAIAFLLSVNDLRFFVFMIKNFDS